MVLMSVGTFDGADWTALESQKLLHPQINRIGPNTLLLAKRLSGIEQEQWPITNALLNCRLRITGNL